MRKFPRTGRQLQLQMIVPRMWRYHAVDDLESEEIEKKVEVKKEAQRKRKHTKETKLDRALCTVVESVTKAQKESDELFIALEGKRMKLEEQMLIMEDR